MTSLDATVYRQRGCFLLKRVFQTPLKEEDEFRVGLRDRPEL